MDTLILVLSIIFMLVGIGVAIYSFFVGGILIAIYAIISLLISIVLALYSKILEEDAMSE